MIRAATKSVDDTRALAAEIAALAAPGDLVVLAGDLGTGKTAFAQGFARGLGVEEQVTSPAFILVRTYEGRLPMVHLDVYRLDQMQELVDLGTGKTAFAQGFARGLGVDEPVTSPAFILVRTYEGRLPMVHLDVYRLDQMQELVDLGIAELLDEGAVTLVEWGDAVTPALPSDFLEIRLETNDGAPDDRQLTIRSVGPTWPPRANALRHALAPWTV